MFCRGSDASHPDHLSKASPPANPREAETSAKHFRCELLSRLYLISCPEQSFRQTLLDLAPSAAPCCEPRTKQALPQLSPIKELACRQADTIRENHGNSPHWRGEATFKGRAKAQGLIAQCIKNTPSLQEKGKKPTWGRHSPLPVSAYTCMVSPQASPQQG